MAELNTIGRKLYSAYARIDDDGKSTVYQDVWVITCIRPLARWSKEPWVRLRREGAVGRSALDRRKYPVGARPAQYKSTPGAALRQLIRTLKKPEAYAGEWKADDPAGFALYLEGKKRGAAKAKGALTRLVNARARKGSAPAERAPSAG